MDAATVGTWVAVALTLMVLSYILGDNPFYKLAEHIFVGASVGWTFVLIYRNVFLGSLLYPMRDHPSQNLSLLVPLILGVLLLLRPVRQLAWLSNSTLAMVIGAGAALSIVGASAGLLGPQFFATVLPIFPTSMDLGGLWLAISNIVIVLGVISTLLYFHFTGKQLGRFGRPVELAAGLGKYTMMIAFGALFASIAISRISVLVGRISFLYDVVR